MTENKIAQASQQKFLPLLIIIILSTMLGKILLLYDFHYLPLVGDEYRYWNKSLETFHYYWNQLDYQAPLYPLFLALNQIIFGEHALLLVRLEQIFLHSLEIFLLYIIARRFFSEKTALTAGIIASFYPELVSYSYLIFSETMFLALFLASLIFYFRGLERDSPRAVPDFICSGILFGLASLTRSVNFFFFPILIFHLLLFKKALWKEKILLSLYFTLALLAPISVQTVKNYQVAHCFILIDNCLGQNLHHAHNPDPPPHYDYKEFSRPEKYSRARCPASGPCEQTRCEMKNALEFIKTHPSLTLRRAGLKIIDLYTPNLFFYRNLFPEQKHPKKYISRPNPSADKALDKYRGIWFRVLGSGSYLLLMLLALFGLVSSTEWKFRSLTLLLLFYHTLTCAFFFAHSRMRIPFVPFLIIYGGFFLSRERDWRKLTPGKILLAFGLWLLLFILTLPRLLLVLE